MECEYKECKYYVSSNHVFQYRCSLKGVHAIAKCCELMAYKKGRESIINKNKCHECSAWEETYHKFCANCGRKVTKRV